MDKSRHTFIKISQLSRPTSDFWNDTVLQNIDYGRYLLGHKLNLADAGIQIGLNPGKVIAHDWSKFKPKKFDIYEDYFFGPRGIRGKLSSGVYKDFRKEVEDHYHTEAHHRDKIGLPEDTQTEMESIVDWYSVGKTNADMKGQDFPSFRDWWNHRKFGFLIKRKLSKQAYTKIETELKKNYNILTYSIAKIKDIFK